MAIASIVILFPVRQAVLLFDRDRVTQNPRNALSKMRIDFDVS
ncbi:hypothetical protein [Novosphingobium resinovorum]